MRERDDIWAQLRTLQGMAEKTGAIHEAQALQLRTWGWCAFPHVAPVDIVVEVAIDARDVVYKIPETTKKPPKDFVERIAMLDESIRELLGKDWRLLVEKGCNLLYKGPREMTSSEKTNEQRKTKTRSNRARRDRARRG